MSIRRTTIVLGCFLAGALSYAAELKLGVFDFQRVTEETARGQELQAALGKFREKKQSEIAAKEKELKTLRDQYAAQALSLTPDKRSQLEKEIQKKDSELQTFREGAQREMQIEVNEAQSRFQEQLFKVIHSLGKDRGYTLILERTQAVYASDGADITSEVVERFNQESSKEPAGAASASPPPPAAPNPAEAKKGAPPKPPAGKPAESKPPSDKPREGAGAGKPPATRVEPGSRPIDNR